MWTFLQNICEGSYGIPSDQLNGNTKWCPNGWG